MPKFTVQKKGKSQEDNKDNVIFTLNEVEVAKKVDGSDVEIVKPIGDITIAQLKHQKQHVEKQLKAFQDELARINTKIKLLNDSLEK